MVEEHSPKNTEYTNSVSAIHDKEWAFVSTDIAVKKKTVQ